MSVTLPPDLLGTAEALVATGRYADVESVMRSALALLRTQEDRRAALIRSIEEAEAEAERDGYVGLEEVLDAMDAVIAAVEAQGETQGETQGEARREVRGRFSAEHVAGTPHASSCP